MKAIDLPLMWKCQDNGAVNGIPYVWGAKPSSSLTTDQISGADCSGWWRYLMGRQGIEVPEGSQEQMEWCKAQGFQCITNYADVGNAAAGELFACFILDTRGHQDGHAGHVWNCEGGETMESHGGAGVDSRPWNTGVLRREFHVAFRLPVLP